MKKNEKYKITTIIETEGHMHLTEKVEQYLNKMVAPLESVVSVSINSMDGVAFIVTKVIIQE
jgi:hypothetical protein